MSPPLPIPQVPAHLEYDSDGVLMNVCRLPRVYYAKVQLRMKNGARVTPASILPYITVRNTPEAPNTWRVAARPYLNTGLTDAAGWCHIRVSGPGRYRVYIKEPTEVFADDSLFTVQQHARADGSDSGREVQPLFELKVTENADCSLSVQRTHPNGLQRTCGGDDDHIPADGPPHRFTEAHTNFQLKKALDLGDYLVSFQLWADASRAYGSNHPRIQNSRFRAPLTLIYSEQLTHGTGDDHDRTLAFNHREVLFEVLFQAQSTTGGRARLSFLQNNGQPGNRMTADESLRRTHPATLDFLLQMMDALDIHYVRSTGAWRPHFGSTRHRYASAIDLTHVRTGAADQDTVTVHFDRGNSPNSNPSPTGQPETATRTRMREFSRRVHVYIASARAQGTLGWLGGPWPLTYRQLGIANPADPNGEAIATDPGHNNHLHISMGTDQP